MDSATAIATLVARWSAEGIAAAPATPEQLDELEASLGVPLPAAMRELYSAADGTETYPDDWLMILPLEIVAGSVARDGDTISLTIGDFMESLHAIVVRLRPEGESVWRSSATGDEQLAPDLATFLALAAADTRGLFT